MRRSDEARWVLQVVIAAALVACTGSSGNTDAGHTGTDGGGDTGPAPLQQLMPAQANGAAAMLTCSGTAMEPAAGAAVSITLDLVAFGQHGDRAPMTHVCFCGDNVLSPESLMAQVMGTTPTCGTCQDVTTDSSGHATVNARANGWYAYRVFGHHGSTPGTTFLDSIQVNEPAPASSGGTVTGNAVTLLTENLILAAELLQLVPGTTTVAGRLGDCGGNDMSNAIIRAFREDGSEVIPGPEVTDQHIQYFDGSENPDASATFTNTDGLYVVVNIPTMQGELLRVESWAYTGTDPMGDPVRVGCEAVHAFPDGVSIVNIGPLRSDYAPIDGMPHPCAAH